MSITTAKKVLAFVGARLHILDSCPAQFNHQHQCKFHAGHDGPHVSPWFEHMIADGYELVDHGRTRAVWWSLIVLRNKLTGQYSFRELGYTAGEIARLKEEYDVIAHANDMVRAQRHIEDHKAGRLINVTYRV